jgi:uncharacterized small protein (DUF1192 family)
MRDEDERPKPKAGPLSDAELQLLGLDELEARIADLRAQIAACEALIAAKRAQRSLADQVFAKRGD